MRFPRVLHRTEKTPSVHVKEGKSDGDSETEATISPHWPLAPSLGHRCVWFSHKVFKFF